MNDSELVHQLIRVATAVHRGLGPGLPEAAYEECLCLELSRLGIPFERQKLIPVRYRGTQLDWGYRADVLVGNRVILEVKAVAAVGPIHDTIMLASLRLSGCRTGLLINFHSAVLKDGIHRYIWNYNSVEPEAECPDAEVAQHARKEDSSLDCQARPGWT